MSRICVKNMPKDVTEDRLRELFSQKGEVTDTRVKRTKEGKSRLGFVGFRTEREAEEAIKYFNNSFMFGNKIICEIAMKVGDPNIPRPWSRHSLKKKKDTSEEDKKLNGSKASKAVAVGLEGQHRKREDNMKDDPKLQEFLEVMQPGRSQLWANDAVASFTPSLDRFQTVLNDESLTAKGNKEKLDVKNAKLEGRKEEGEDILRDLNESHPERTIHDGAISDMDYFKSRIKKNWSDSENSDNEITGDGNDLIDGDDRHHSNFSEEKSSFGPLQDEVELVAPDSEAQSSPEKESDALLESGRLFIRNLPYTATEEELEAHFSKFGAVSQVHIVIDKDTRRSKGIAYVLFALPECACRALEETDFSIFQGRLLHVMPAKQKSLSSDMQGTINTDKQTSKSFKQQRKTEKKAAEANGNTRAWNSLFMRSDTVVENIARKVGVSKSELLDRESDDLAVRIALGETQVIAETKKALSSAGINISSLEEFAAGRTEGLKRSNHVILVKNLPYGSSENELSTMFAKFGGLDKIILPPTKTLALVIFLEPAEARAAFKGLAYKRYKDSPLYLEWAPANILSHPSSVADSEVVDGLDVSRALLSRVVDNEITDADIEPDRVESRSLYVKNLNFKTTEESMKRHFSDHMKEGMILSARVKKHLKNGKNVSMGFGFIEFNSVDTAMNVCRDLQGSVLDGHALMLQLCHVKNDEMLLKKVESDRSSTKLIVRNVAFEATEKDLRQLFSPFGQIKSLRLPMRFGKHRGFGFVEFLTKQETRNALEALSNTHLYGRRLVLERAKDGETLDELQDRTAAHFMDTSKLSKKRKHLTILDEGNIKFNRISE